MLFHSFWINQDYGVAEMQTTLLEFFICLAQASVGSMPLLANCFSLTIWLRVCPFILPSLVEKSLVL